MVHMSWRSRVAKCRGGWYVGRCGPYGRLWALRSAETWTRKVILLGDEVIDLVRDRLQLPVHQTSDPASRTNRAESSNSSELREMIQLASALRRFAADPATSAVDNAAAATQLAELRPAAASNDLVRQTAGECLAQTYALL